MTEGTEERIVPTTEQLRAAEAELEELIARKKQIERNLANLEVNIYNFEGSYLEDTQQHGNIIRGFEGYLSSRGEKRRYKFTAADRLFSNSSATYLKALEVKEKYDEGISGSGERRERRNSIRKKKRDKSDKNDLSDADYEM